MTAKRKPPRNATIAALAGILDDLTRRGLIERTQVVQADGVSIQLGPAPYAPPALTHGEEPPEQPKQPHIADLIYGASEGINE